MITPAFDRTFRNLVHAFKRHQDVPRSPGNIPAIGEARWELHLARDAMAAERREVLAVHERRWVGKIDISDEDLARLNVAAISAGFS